MSIDLARRAFIAGFNWNPNDIDQSKAFEEWWRSELDAVKGEPAYLEAPNLPAVVEPFDFSKLPRPGDANYKSRGNPFEFPSARGQSLPAPDGRARGIERNYECAASDAGCCPVDTRKGVLCQYCGRDMSND